MELKSKVGPIVAIALTGAAVLWVYAGGNGITAAQHDDKSVTNNQPQANSTPPHDDHKFSVQAKMINAQAVTLHLALSGQTQADKTLTITNTVKGKVVNKYADKGAYLKQGDPILQIDVRSLKSQIEQARLLVKQRELELEGLKKLKAKNLTSSVNLAQAKTNLASAKASLESLEVNLENAKVVAPFSGVLNTMNVEQNQMLGDNTPIGTLVSIDPLRIQVNIPQSKIGDIHQGTVANVQLESGITTHGTVSYMSAEADQASRTISVELLVNNPDNRIPAGITADVDFTIGTQNAQAFSAALLTLNNDGNTAVKILDKENRVIVKPVTIVKSERDQVWVTGLPDEVKLITVGQGFVSGGDLVDVHM